MKKIILIFSLLFILSSCFGEKKQDDNKIVDKTTTNNQIIDNTTTTKKVNKTINIDLNEFSVKISNNPDLLLNIKCEDYGNDEVLNYCNKKKNEYMKIYLKNKNKSTIKEYNKEDINSFEKEIKRFEDKTKKDGELILKQNCEEFNNKEVVKICENIKKDILKQKKEILKQKKEIKVTDNLDKKNNFTNFIENRNKLLKEFYSNNEFEGNFYINKKGEYIVMVYNKVIDNITKKLGCYDGLKKGLCIISKETLKKNNMDIQKIYNNDFYPRDILKGEILIDIKVKEQSEKLKNYGCIDGLEKGFCIINILDFNKIIGKK